MFWVTLRHQFTCLLNSKIKNWERSNTLPNLQANKSTCHCFLGIGIKNKILGSDTKGFDIWGIESSVMVGTLQKFHLSPSPGADADGLRFSSAHTLGSVIGKVTKLRISLFYQDWRSLSKPNSRDILFFLKSLLTPVTYVDQNLWNRENWYVHAF